MLYLYFQNDFSLKLTVGFTSWKPQYWVMNFLKTFTFYFVATHRGEIMIGHKCQKEAFTIFVYTEKIFTRKTVQFLPLTYNQDLSTCWRFFNSSTSACSTLHRELNQSDSIKWQFLAIRELIKSLSLVFVPWIEFLI